jgi:3-oxoacyl-[acyl-carrier protein] reductase
VKRFAGKNVLITGGARDIGRASALRLAEEGARVALTYNASADKAKEVVEQIVAGGGEAIAMQADLTTPESVQGALNQVAEQFSELDALVHVTGGMIARKTMLEMDLAFWHQVLDVNLTSLFLTCKAAIPILSPGAAIVTFSSQAGRDGGGAGAIAYATSKGAVMTFTRGLAKELGTRARVNAICAGMIETTFHDTFTRPEVREKVAASTALKRQGKAEEVAALVAFLASGDASYITGACYDINGGILFS